MSFQDLVAHARAHSSTDDLSRRELAKGQAPAAMFIGCSDSRIVPTAIFGAGPGELFELRTAGNVIPTVEHPTSEIATIEYAVAVLQVPNIVLCGHRHCGAVAALTSGGVDSDKLPTLGRWLAGLSGPTAEAAEQEHLEQLHLLNQFTALQEIPAVRERVDSGDLQLHCWFYDIGTGSVSHWTGDAHAPSFAQL